MGEAHSVPDFWIWGTGDVTGCDYLVRLPSPRCIVCVGPSGSRSRRVASWSALSAPVAWDSSPKAGRWPLTLSTCTYDRADGTGRVLVQGKLLEGYSNGAAGN